jgi:WD40 repeat protein/serine/threonine protein kinase
VVPGYEIVRELGRGGMGVVYEARQVGLNRTVALKMILAGGHASAADIDRFRTEREAVARLLHPNIVQVYETGAHAGLPYFSLEFCPGGSLDRKLNGTPWEPMPAAKLIETLARAIQHAHEHGIVHRDLKPGNVLLAADGTPKVTDFGLAKRLDSAAGLTRSGAILGTPSYMAPEQAGTGEAVGPRADVYALGAILYQLLTGRPPFKATTDLDTILQVVEQEPVPPTRLNSKTPRDLETIVLKCLAKEPAERYPSATGLAEDLRRFREGEPILARPAGPLERTIKWTTRRPTLAGLLAVSVLAIASLSIGGVWFTVKLHHERNVIQTERDVAQTERDNAQREKTEAERQRNLADEREREARSSLYASQLTLAQVAWRDGDVGRLREILDGQRPQPGRDDLRGFEWYYLWHLCHRDLFTLRGHAGVVTRVAFSPDGKRIMSASREGSSIYGTIKLWDVSTRQEVRTLRGPTGEIFTLALSPDGKWLACPIKESKEATSDGRTFFQIVGTVRVWDTMTGQEVHNLQGHTKEVVAVAYSPDGKHIISLGADGTLRTWDAATGRETQSLKLKGLDRVFALGNAFSPDVSRVAVGLGSGQKTVKVWDTRTGEMVFNGEGHSAPVGSVAFSPDGDRLASGSGVEVLGINGEVIVWNLTTANALCTLKGHKGEVFGMAFAPDGNRLASSSKDGMVKVWDVRAGQELFTLKGHTGPVMDTQFSVDGRYLASSSADKTVKVWNATVDPETSIRNNDTEAFTGFTFASDGGHLLVGHRSLDGTKTGVRDLEAQRDLLSWKGKESETVLASDHPFSHNGTYVATGSFDAGGAMKVRVWETATGRELVSLVGRAGGIERIAFSPDGKQIAFSTKDQISGAGPTEISLWDGTTGQTTSFKVASNNVTCLAFNPDGQRIAIGCRDGELDLWAVPTGRPDRSLKGHTTYVRSVVFSPDGKRLASSGGAAGQPAEVKLWDTSMGNEIVALKGHSDLVASVTYSPDGKRIATGSADKTVRVWDSATGQELLSLKGHAVMVTSVVFSSDGRRLGSMDGGRSLHVWEAGTDR